MVIDGHMSRKYGQYWKRRRRKVLNLCSCGLQVNFFKLNTIFILLRIIKLTHLFESIILTGGLFKTCVTCNTGNVIIDNIGKDTVASIQ